MFLSERSRQEEYTDAPDLPAEVIAANYEELARVNRVLMFAEPFQRYLTGWLGEERCRALSILDLGAGDGSLGRELTQWARGLGWDWQVTNLDRNPIALRLASTADNVAGSVVALPFANDSFDVVIASQMTHHLTETTAVTDHFREAWRVTRDAVLISDIHRNAGIYAFIWVLLKILRLSPLMCHDGLLSVRRGWRLPEWSSLAQAAGMENVRVWVYYGSRIMLRARKPGPHCG